MPALAAPSFNRAALTTAIGLLQRQLDDAVNKPSKRYDELFAMRKLARTLMGGTVAMREAGREFLPQHPAESDGSYALRLNSTTLYNGFAETVVAQSAKFFGDPVVLGEDVPPELVTLCENIDGQGRALTPFCVDLAKEGFIDGISLILVEYPQIASGMTLADVRAMRAQPYWVLIKANDLIGWRTRNINGQQVLTQVRIRETICEDKGEFGETEVKRVRVLEPGRWRVYEQRADLTKNETAWFLSAEGASSLPYIPLVPFYTNRLGYMEGAPPLRTLAELNREHWHSSSEQRRALSFLRFAMLLIKGADKRDVTIAPDKVIYLPVDGDAKHVEHTGAGIEAGLRDIQAIEARMQSAGMELRVENAGSVTATAAAIDSAETNAGLRAVAKGLQDAIEQALLITAEILGLSDGGSVEVKDDFGAAEIPGTVSDLNLVRSGGGLSLPSYWEELKRRGVLDEDFDPAKEQVLLEEETAKQMEQQAAYFQQQQELAAAQQPSPAEGAPSV